MNIDSAHQAVGLDQERLEYRALSSGAVIALILGVVSWVIALLARDSLQASLMLSPVPLLGLLVGIRSWLAIRRRPEELTGRGMALAGLLLSGSGLLAGVGLATHSYVTEVPEGYARISYNTLQPDERQRRRKLLVPPEIMQLEGKKVFIRGYMRPSSQRLRLREFLLVRDNMQCCFGALNKVKYHDMVAIRLEKPLRVDYRTQSFGVGGTLHIDPASARPGAEAAVFSLEADYIR
jgi:hypothetical protein